MEYTCTVYNAGVDIGYASVAGDDEANGIEQLAPLGCLVYQISTIFHRTKRCYHFDLRYTRMLEITLQ